MTKPVRLAAALGVFLLGLLASSVSRAVPAEESPGFWSVVPHRTVVGGREAEHGALTVLVDGGAPPAGTVVFTSHKEIPHLRINLRRERETAVLVHQGDKVLFRGRLFYAPPFNSVTVPPGFEPLFFHGDEQEEPCRSCHRLEAKAGDRLPSPGPGPASMCYPCHREEFSAATYSHKTATEWQCLVCHGGETAGVDGSKYWIPAELSQEGLCLGCHKKTAAALEKHEYLHGPLAMGSCTSCHDPHGTRYKMLLHAQITDLCVDCHDLRQDMLGRPYLHKVLEKEGCVACHDAHGSARPFQLRMQPARLCVKCHPGIGATDHPVRGHPVAGGKDPRYENRPLSCVSCHDPHSSEHSSLLPDADVMMLCARCHRYGGS